MVDVDRGVEGAARIDTHVHLWDAIADPEALRLMPSALHRAFTLAELERELAATRTASVVLVETGGSESDLTSLRRNAATSEQVVGFVAYADPHGPPIDGLLERLVEDPKFLGVRFRFEGTPTADLDEARILDAARAVTDRDLTLELLVTTDQLPVVRRLAGRLPGGRVIVDHLAKPDLRHPAEFETWQKELRALANETAFAMKLSVSPRAVDLVWLAARGRGGWEPAEIRPYLSACLEAFGPGRVAWGSDWPIAALGGPYRSAVDLMAEALGTLDAESEAQVFSGTAKRVYRLRS